jgi:hypothetical protein
VLVPASKLQRESDYIKSQFNYDLLEMKTWMEPKAAGVEDGSLSLPVACLDVAVQKPGKCKVKLSSLGWFAAGMYVPEIVREQEGASSVPN